MGCLQLRANILEGSEFFLQSQTSNGAIMLNAPALAQADLFSCLGRLPFKEQWSILYMG